MSKNRSEIFQFENCVIYRSFDAIASIGNFRLPLIISQEYQQISFYSICNRKSSHKQKAFIVQNSTNRTFNYSITWKVQIAEKSKDLCNFLRQIEFVLVLFCFKNSYLWPSCYVVPFGDIRFSVSTDNFLFDNRS